MSGISLSGTNRREGVSLSRQRRSNRPTGLQWTAEAADLPDEPVSTSTAAEFLALGNLGQQATVLATIIQGVRQLVEKRIGRLLIRRNVTAEWSRVPSYVSLPLPPHGEVQSVVKYTGQGQSETLPDDKWYTRGLDRIKLYPNGGADHGLKVEFTAGYESCPRALRMQMLRDIADRYDKRDDVVLGESVTTLPDSSAYDAWRVLG